MTATSDVTFKLLQLKQLKNIGSVTLEKLASNPQFSLRSFQELTESVARKTEQARSAVELVEATSFATQQLEKAAQAKARIVSILDPDYPELLREIPGRPVLLFIKGQLHSAQQKSIAVIGTRQPTEHGVGTAARISAMFVEQGWSIVSGLALGCDAVAHNAALTHHGHTVAVLAHGLQTIAPKQHQKLADQIVADGGCLLTEYPFGVPPISFQYVKRDKIQAGLARGVVLIQSDETGGSMHASKAAIEYRRTLAVAQPTPRDSANFEPKIGANRILCGLDEHAKAKLLNCKLSDIDRIFCIRTRDDYPSLLEVLRDNSSMHSSLQELPSTPRSLPFV